MGFWYYVSEEQKDETELIGISREALHDRQFLLELADDPMNIDFFMYVIPDLIRNMRMGENNFLTIGYPITREDRISCIQIQRMEPANGFWIEVVMHFDDGLNFHTYCKNSVSTNDAIRIFKEVLVDYSRPDLSEWDEITDIVLEGSRRAYERIKKEEGQRNGRDF